MKSSFQTILIIVCLVVFVVAVLGFSGVIPLGSSSSNQKISGRVVVWGTYPQQSIQGYFDQLNVANVDMSVNYIYKNPETFKSELINALADGNAPDIVINDSEHLFSFKDRLYVIPYATYAERLYRDTFVDGASIFLDKDGVFSLPLLVDPLVVYYNKDLLAGQNYVTPPTTWTGLVQSIPRFLKKDARGIITQTAVGLGESDNVNHFKDILSTLFLQTGNSIVSLNSANGKYEQRVGLGAEGQDELPTAKALSFYTGFSNQTNNTFSWTRSLPPSLDMFLSGRSAFYIGRASELFTIQSRNPNLNFDVTSMFQVDGAVRPITYGVFSGVSIIKTTQNFTAAYSVLGSLTSNEFIQYLSTVSSLPSARRDQLLTKQTNPYIQVYFKSALSTFSWPDIDTKASSVIFRDMIGAVNSGRLNANQAISNGARDLQSAVNK